LNLQPTLVSNDDNVLFYKIDDFSKVDLTGLSFEEIVEISGYGMQPTKSE